MRRTTDHHDVTYRRRDAGRTALASLVLIAGLLALLAPAAAAVAAAIALAARSVLRALRRWSAPTCRVGTTETCGPAAA
jgi:hypothetical protein